MMYEVQEDDKSIITTKDNIIQLENFNYNNTKHSEEDYNDNLSDWSTNFVIKICDSINN
jgi:hypothetical protein